MKTKKKVVTVAGIAVTPWTAAEKRRIEVRIKKKYDRLRRRYEEVRGKRVDFVKASIEDGDLYFSVHFIDRTALHLIARPSEVRLERIELSDWKTGDGKILRTYFRRRDENHEE